MFKKILIANRGEIAARIERTCREMGIQTVALYEKADEGSLHVRLADECVLLGEKGGFVDPDLIVRLAQEKGVDAIHPGYGFWAEEADFIGKCETAGITFIGPPAEVVRPVRNKIAALEYAHRAGFPTTEHSQVTFGETEFDALRVEAERLGYPLIIKSCRGGRGRGERLVRTAGELERAVHRAQTEAYAVYADRSVYLEKAIQPAHQISVQILADGYGNLVHLGEREGSLIQGNQKIVEETPAPSLTPVQRERLWQMALDLARLFKYQNVGSVEFLVDQAGNLYFTEIKARISTASPLTELVSRVDLVREQIRIAAGEPFTLTSWDAARQGWAMECHIRAEDPSTNFMPSPGRLRRVRLPGGPEVRVDTFAYSGCDVPPQYDPLIAKLVVWGRNRALALEKMQRALDEINLFGTATNIALLQRIVRNPDFAAGNYTTQFLARLFNAEPNPPEQLRDLAVAAAVLFARESEVFQPTVPERVTQGWHRESRRLPE
jgi:acetyl-CoA carboxylase, biotin carboxylase subunit